MGGPSPRAVERGRGCEWTQYEEVHVPAGIDVTDTVTNDGAGTSVDDAKKSGKRKAKEKEEVVKKEKNDEDELPAKRERKSTRR